MAATDFGSLTGAQKRVYAMTIFMAGRDDSFFESNGFMSRNNGAVIERITELTKTERGDRVIMNLVHDLVGDGIVGDNILEGNEEPLFNDKIELRIDQIRNAVRNKGKMAEQRTVLRFRTVANDKLSFWAAEKLDEMFFLTLAGINYSYKLDGSTRATSQLPQLAFNADVVAPSSGRKKFAGSATSTATLTASDKITWNTVIGLQSYAKRKKLRPIRAGGKEHYVMVLSTEGRKDLVMDPTYQQNVGRAGPRGSDSPLFKNALAVIDGVIIYDHNKVPTTLGLASGSKWGSGGTVEGSQSFLLGAQALGYSTLGAVEYNESDNTDYGNRPAISAGRMLGMLKPQFGSLTDLDANGKPTKQDFGVISFYHAITA
jgi:N4-gp56 family major capsid protein